MGNKKIHKYTVITLLSVIAFFATTLWLSFNFPKIMGVAAIVMMVMIVIAVIYGIIYLAFDERERNKRW